MVVLLVLEVAAKEWLHENILFVDIRKIEVKKPTYHLCKKPCSWQGKNQIGKNNRF